MLAVAVEGDKDVEWQRGQGVAECLDQDDSLPPVLGKAEHLDPPRILVSHFPQDALGLVGGTVIHCDDHIGITSGIAGNRTANLGNVITGNHATGPRWCDKLLLLLSL